MSDLIVDYGVLENSERLLASLHQQLGAGSNSSLAADSDWGYGDVVSAMGGFYGDWSYHRQQIMGRMQTLHTMTQQSRQSFQAADNKLASDLTRSGSAASRGAGTGRG